MKGADPKCRVIGGLGGGPRQMTRELIDAGILGQIDILNLHMYPGLRAPETFVDEMDALLAMMDVHGGRKPIWITEFLLLRHRSPAAGTVCTGFMVMGRESSAR